MQQRKELGHDIQKKLKQQKKIEQNAETIKPTAINESIIQDYLVSYNKENKIFDDDRPTWEMTHLALSFKSKLSASPLKWRRYRYCGDRQLVRNGEVDQVIAWQQHHNQDLGSWVSGQPDLAGLVV